MISPRTKKITRSIFSAVLVTATVVVTKTPFIPTPEAASKGGVKEPGKEASKEAGKEASKEASKDNAVPTPSGDPSHSSLSLRPVTKDENSDKDEVDIHPTPSTLGETVSMRDLTIPTMHTMHTTPTLPRDVSSVAVLDGATGRVRCSGVLVGSRSVLTAAHCLDGGGLELWVAFSAGTPITEETLRKSPPTMYKVSAAAAHPAYGGREGLLTDYEHGHEASHEASYETGHKLGHKPDHDLAILTLPRPAPPGWRPVHLSLEGELDRFGSLVFFGYGLGGRSGGYDNPGEFRQIHLNGMLLRPGGVLYVWTTQPPYVCYGDSGGGIFKNKNGELELVGIISEALTPFGVCILGGGGVNVGANAEWISRTVSRLATAAGQ